MVNLPEPCLLSHRKVLPELFSGDNERGLGIEERPTGLEELGNLPEQFYRVGHFMDNKDSEGGVKGPVQVDGEVEGVRLAPVCPDSWQQTFRLHLPPQYIEHLLLQVDGEDLPVLPDTLCKLAGEEARPAAEIKDTVPGLHVPLCKAVGPVEKPPKAGIQVPGSGSREDFVLMRGHWEKFGERCIYKNQSGKKIFLALLKPFGVIKNQREIRRQEGVSPHPCPTPIKIFFGQGFPKVH